MVVIEFLKRNPVVLVFGNRLRVNPRLFVFICWLIACQPYFCCTSSSQIKDFFVMKLHRTPDCAEYGQLVELVCNLTSASANPNDTDLMSWKLVWRSMDTEITDSNVSVSLFRNSLVVSSRLQVQLNWLDTKQFTCLAIPFVKRSATFSGGMNNVTASVNISETVALLATKPLPVEKGISGQFVETRRGQILEIFWYRVSDSLSSMRYCIEDYYDELWFDKELAKSVCPNSVDVTSSCSLGPGNNAEPQYVCKGEVRYGRSALTDLEHKVYVRFEQKGFPQCAVEMMAIFTLVKLSDNAYNKNTSLLLKPFPVAALKVKPLKSAFRQQTVVTVTWSDPSFVCRDSETRDYMLEVNCSGSPMGSVLQTKQTNISLEKTDFRPGYHPYALCTFCVKARIAEGGLYSEAKCQWTRLPEEKPDSAPRITCSGTKCKTLTNGSGRNVTVTWVLPPRETWNGVLVKLLLGYCRQGNWSEMRYVYVRNITQNTTRGSTKLVNLDSRAEYVVHMKACTVVGCSRPGNESWISAEKVAPASTIFNDRFSRETVGDHYVIPLAVLCVILIVAVAVIVYLCRRKKLSRREKLPTLTEPANYVDMAMAESSSTVYSEIEGSCLELKVGSTKSLAIY